MKLQRQSKCTSDIWKYFSVLRNISLNREFPYQSEDICEIWMAGCHLGWAKVQRSPVVPSLWSTVSPLYLVWKKKLGPKWGKTILVAENWWNASGASFWLKSKEEEDKREVKHEAIVSGIKEEMLNCRNEYKYRVLYPVKSLALIIIFVHGDGYVQEYPFSLG